MNDLSFTILKIVVSACSALITVFVVPYLRRLAENEKLTEIMKAVNVAVSAAEQTIKGSGKGAEKKHQVIEFMLDWMHSRGISFDAEQIDGLIEAAVYGLKAGRTE